MTATCGGLWHRGPAPKETFTRSQLAAMAAISSIFMDFRGFPQISWIFIDFMCFLMISWDFMDFGGLGGGPGVGCLTSCGDAVAACAAETLPLKKALLDSSWLL